MNIQKLFVSLGCLLGFSILLMDHASAQLFTELTKQDTTLVYKLPGYEKDPIRANLKREVVQKDSIWTIILTDSKRNKVEEISYEDAKLEVRKGIYRLYQNQKLAQEGLFDKGYHHGEWKTYFVTGKLALVCNFRWDKLWGKYQKFDADQKLIEEGYYRNDQKIGKWLKHLESGKIETVDYGNP